MKEDIIKPEVKNVTVAVAKKVNDANVEEWSVYLINQNDHEIENTLVTSKGYGEQGNEIQKTSTLRHFLQTVDANSAVLIEPIQKEVFHLNNEYWVSYYIESKIYDKKFIFLPDSIKDENLTYIKELDTKGILHS
ncbi:hypothetical protein [Fulvivirga lutea]|uniref:Uncharacterized protein n=1 Tax=Fulvivirga lutea TaxID=2810512 RepID=A0A974WGU0_9BACT|nr:hypothetical protein [Fulvivirga lutea]QSE98071.1 hypothetical protein JR347_03030 [Fulvivirga lutea]